MEWILVVVALAGAVFLAGGRWFGRRRTEPGTDVPPVRSAPEPDDDWMPVEEPLDRPQEMPPQALDRAMLLHRNRVLDPSAWDNTPDATRPATDEGEGAVPPAILDRDFLRSRQREDSPGEDRPS